MSSSALLTRLLLIATLILNGSGYALAASGGMTLASHTHAPAVSMPSNEAMPCHDADMDPVAFEKNPLQPDDAREDPDCCKAGNCLHACHQLLAHATSTVAFVAAAIIASQDAIRPLASPHAAPAPPRLIRPPIA